MSATKKTAANKPKKLVVKEPTIIPATAVLRKKPRYKSFKLQKRVKHHGADLPTWWKITGKAFRLLQQNKRALLSFFIFFGLLYLIFINGFSSPVDVDGIRDTFEGVLDKQTTTLAVNVSVLALLVQSTVLASGEIQGMYQFLMIIVSVLALIWLYRQQQAGNKVTMKDAYYRGMYPLIPFLLLLFVIALQTIPAAIGNNLFRSVIDSGLAINMVEQAAWLLLFLLFSLFTLYLVSSTIIALFVVTLPGMTPKKALKQAKKMVQYRRFSVMRKIFGLFFLVVLVFVGVVFPVIFISPLLAQILFYTLLIMVLPFTVAYLFVLYRELL